MKLPVDVEPGAARAPLQPVAEPDAPDEADQLRIGWKDHVIEAVPHEFPEVVPGREATELLGALVDRHRLAGIAQAFREREAHEASADDADARSRHWLRIPGLR